MRACLLLLIAATMLNSPRNCCAGSPVGLRINTTHALDNAKGAVTDAGLKLSTEVQVTPSAPDNGRSFLNPERFIEDAKTAGAQILSSSFSNWQSGYDSLFYQKLTQNGMVHVYAYEPRQPQPANAPPPAAFVTVNRIGGMTGHGIEFGVPVGYMHGKGQSDSPSGVTAQLAGLMASLKYRHPLWNWFDIKAALRSTAANFATGYDPRSYGYGAIDFHAANALNDAGKLPLFAPAAVVFPQKGNRLIFFINPFRQSRRAADALFKFAAAPSPRYKEITLSEITSLGGRLVLAGDFTKKGNLLAMSVDHDETAYFVWFTRDVQGNYSRIEPYSILGPIKLAPKNEPLYGPRLPAGAASKSGK